jgi:hypothetical protein
MINDEEQLQLDAGGFDKAFIQRKVDSLPLKVWGGQVRLDFSPSNQNRLDIILIDHSTPSYQVRLEIGQTGSPDPLYLVYESMDTFITVPTGISFEREVDFSYKVDVKGNLWQYHIITPDSSTSDSTYFPLVPIDSGYFKLDCHFTSSRSDRFYFDNLYAGSEMVDTMPPRLDTLWVVDSSSISLMFNEALGSLPGPESVFLTGDNQAFSTGLSTDSLSMTIHLDESLESGQEYDVTIARVNDQNGNGGSVSSTFTYYDIGLARPYDILITEIMADPSPALGLPECEYIEIFNRSSAYFRMSDYTLADDSRQVFLPNEILAPGEYAIIMDEDCCEVYDTTIKVWCLENMPAFNNDADVVEILDYVGRSIHRVAYERSWHADGQEEGGWSLEMIDMRQPCFEDVNWTSANFTAFGSPGRPNSVQRRLELDKGPKITEARMDTGSVILELDRALHPELQPTIGIKPDLQVRHIERRGPRSLYLHLDESPKVGTGYLISLKNIHDCLGEALSNEVSATLFLPRPMVQGDLVINEVLFDPFSGGSDFVEVKNVSEDHIKVDRVCLECRHPSDTSLSCTQIPIPLAPGQVIAWSEDTLSLKNHYSTGHLYQNDLVRLPDEGGQLILKGKVGTRLIPIDSMAFSTDLHSPVLTSYEGYSLERVENGMTNSQSQWISATTYSGGATPGLANSQNISPSSSGSDVMSTPYSSFSPNGDGHRDFLPIDIQLPDTGYIGRIDIFEQNGSPLGSILREGLIGSSFSTVWSGRVEGSRLSPGFYILRGLFVHPEGERLVSKVSCFLMP